VPCDSSNAPATVSHGIKIKGEISGQGDFFLDGVFEGTVHLPDGTFTVGPNARVTAEIEAREIVIRGEVIGALKARDRVQIWSTGKLTGNMDTRGIMIEDGAVLHSKVAVPHAPITPASVPQAMRPPAATPKEVALPEKDQSPQPSSSEVSSHAKAATASAASPPTSPEP
jgi:cytoskeletal protein CcmA (bactofilin family)